MLKNIFGKQNVEEKKLKKKETKIMDDQALTDNASYRADIQKVKIK